MRKHRRRRPDGFLIGEREILIGEREIHLMTTSWGKRE